MPVTMKLQDNIIEFLGLRKNVVALLTRVILVGTFHFLSRGKDLR
jgi:hypothetical protein